MGTCGYFSMQISYLQYNSGWSFGPPYMDGSKLEARRGYQSEECHFTTSKPAVTDFDASDTKPR